MLSLSVIVLKTIFSKAFSALFASSYYLVPERGSAQLGRVNKGMGPLNDYEMDLKLKEDIEFFYRPSIVSIIA